MEHKKSGVAGLGWITTFVLFTLLCDLAILVAIFLTWFTLGDYPPAHVWTWLGLVFGGELLITGGINVAGKVRDWKLGGKDEQSNG